MSDATMTTPDAGRGSRPRSTRYARLFRPGGAAACACEILLWFALLYSTGVLADDPPQPPANPAPVNTGEAGTAGPSALTSLHEIIIIGTSPLLGTGIDADKVPNSTRVLKGSDLSANGGQPSLTNALQAEVGSVNLDSTFGNPYQPDLTFRGFVASPVVGVPQGFAVYQNGVRINEAFGDTVNFDLIPDFAIHSMDLTSTNPVFGFNALGGALAIDMNTGFTFHGLAADLEGGSFGRHSGIAQYGEHQGNWAFYLGAGASNESGWRDSSPSRTDKLYTDVGFRDERHSLDLSVAYANNALSGMGETPPVLLSQDWGAGVDYPGISKNVASLTTLRGTMDLTETLSLQGNVYYRNFHQSYNNGTLLQAGVCSSGNGNDLCTPDNNGNNTVPVIDQYGDAVPTAALNGYGLGPQYPGYDSFSRTHTNTAGGAIQATSTASIAGHGNYFVIGGSVDDGNTDFGSGAQLGAFDSGRYLIPTSLDISSGQNLSNVSVNEKNTYLSAYLTDTFDVTPRLSATASARYNHATLTLTDQLGGDLSGGHHFQHLNPALGATYKLTPTITAFVDFAESNRIPSAAELSCASPTASCSLASFFVADPDLDQVVAQTYEAGLRSTHGAVQWNLSAFRTGIHNDIIEQASQFVGRGYFQNDGDTRRQGIEAGASYRSARWKVFVDYSYVAATFQSNLTLESPFNPQASAAGTIQVHPGDTLPGVPKQRLKIGVDAWATRDWALGTQLSLISSQVLVGDESNQTPPVPAYMVTGIHSEYHFNRRVELYGSIDNLLDRHYYVSGTYTNLSGLPGVGSVGNTVTYTPAQPFGAFVGLRLKL